MRNNFKDSGNFPAANTLNISGFMKETHSTAKAFRYTFI